MEKRKRERRDGEGEGKMVACAMITCVEEIIL
jgi:hypothetical protein